MVRKIEELLVNGEKILNKASIHPIVFAVPATIIGLGVLAGIFFHSLMLVVFLLLSLYPVYQAVVHYKMTDLVLTNKKVLVRMGFLSRDWVRMEFDRIENTYLEQPIIGRMLGYSTVTVSGVGQGEISVRQVKDGDKFVRDLENQLANHNQKVEIAKG